MDYYQNEEMRDIIKRSASILNIDINDESALAIATRSRRTPRIANRLLKRSRDYAEVKGDGTLNVDMVIAALESLEIDDRGLDEVDRALLLAPNG